MGHVGFSFHNLGALFCKGFFFWLGASSVGLTRLKAGLALPIFIHNMALSLRWVGIDCRLYRRNNNDIKPNFSSNLYIYVREELIIDMIIFFHCKYHIGRVPFDVLKRKESQELEHLGHTLKEETFTCQTIDLILIKKLILYILCWLCCSIWYLLAH